MSPVPDKGIVERWLLPAGRVVLEPRESTALDPGGHGGHPLLAPNEPHPVCGECDTPLAFVAHFQAQGRHWRFFYCFDCQPWDDRDRKRGECRLDALPPLARRAEMGGALPPRAWAVEPVLSPPLPEDESSVDGPLPAVYANWISQALEDASPENAPDVQEAFAAWGAWAGPGTQVGGYPHPIQEDTAPVCPLCSRRMDLLVRLDSEDALGLMWGDMGAVYLHACRDHLEQVHFEMQCY